MRILGIDPGLTGAIALLGERNAFEAVADMPTMLRGPSSKKSMVNAAELSRIIREMRPDVAVIEQVNGMPADIGGRQVKLGSAALFNFGDCAGCVRGVLGTLGVPMHFVVPAVWKRRAGLAGNRDKEASRSLAIRLWPMAPLGRKKDSGRAEALLIARYGYRGDEPQSASAA